MQVQTPGACPWAQAGEGTVDGACDAAGVVGTTVNQRSSWLMEASATQFQLFVVGGGRSGGLFVLV